MDLQAEWAEATRAIVLGALGQGVMIQAKTPMRVLKMVPCIWPILMTVSCSPSQPTHCYAGFGIECATVRDGLQCKASVETCTSGAPSGDVTTSVATRWQSSNLNVVSVDRDVVRAVGAGDARVTAEFSGGPSAMTAWPVRVRVFAGHPARLLVDEYAATVLLGPTCDRSTGVGVSGVTVAIVAGLDAGKSTITDSRGHFSIPDTVIDPDEVVTAQKDGYRAATIHFLPNYGFPDLCITPIAK